MRPSARTWAAPSTRRVSRTVASGARGTGTGSMSGQDAAPTARACGSRSRAHSGGLPDEQGGERDQQGRPREHVADEHVERLRGRSRHLPRHDGRGIAWRRGRHDATRIDDGGHAGVGRAQEKASRLHRAQEARAEVLLDRGVAAEPVVVGEVDEQLGTRLPERPRRAGVDAFPADQHAHAGSVDVEERGGVARRVVVEQAEALSERRGKQPADTKVADLTSEGGSMIKMYMALSALALVAAAHSPAVAGGPKVKASLVTTGVDANARGQAALSL